MVGIPRIFKSNSSRSRTDLLINFIVQSCGADYLREAFNDLEHNKKIYTHRGCDATFPKGTQICPKCKMPLR